MRRTIPLFLCAAALWAAASHAQDVAVPLPADPELQAALEARNAAQARVDSLEAAALFAQTQSQIDGAYPAVLAAGVTLAPYPPDKLFVQVLAPLAIATPEERQRWAEAKLAVAECGVRVLERTPGVWTVHRNEVGKVFGAMAAVITPAAPEGGN